MPGVGPWTAHGFLVDAAIDGDSCIDMGVGTVGRTMDIGGAVQSITSGEGEVWLVCDIPGVAVQLRAG